MNEKKKMNCDDALLFGFILGFFPGIAIGWSLVYILNEIMKWLLRL